MDEYAPAWHVPALVIHYAVAESPVHVHKYNESKMRPITRHNSNAVQRHVTDHLYQIAVDESFAQNATRYLN